MILTSKISVKHVQKPICKAIWETTTEHLPAKQTMSAGGV